MRSDHIQKLNSACANLARLAESVMTEHQQQIASMEKILRSANSAAGKTSISKSSASNEPSEIDETVPDLVGLRSAFDAVARAIDGEK